MPCFRSDRERALCRLTPPTCATESRRRPPGRRAAGGVASGGETFDLTTGAFVGRVYDGHQHGDLGVHPGGGEFFMTFELSSPMDPNQPAVGYRDLPGTATVSAPVYLTSLACGGGHISCQGPAGVCLVSYGSWPGDGWTPFETEEFLQYTDGSVLRLAHHRSSECGYWVQPRGSLSRDGSMAIFASDWAAEGGGNSCGSGTPLGEGEAFVIVLGEAAVCGDGTVDGAEQCDDGNTASGDGCDANCTPTGCGNGVVTAGETCDDGNTAGGDCCSAFCAADAPGTDCDDGDVCNGMDVCDANATCVAGVALDCDDGDPCTADTCDALLGCASEDAFAAACREAAVGGLKLLDRAGDRDKLQWRWTGVGAGAGEFGDPLAGDDYSLCVWETEAGVPSRVLAVEVPAGAGWRRTGNGVRFRSAGGAPDGVTTLVAKAAPSGRTKLKVKGGGVNLDLPGPYDGTSYLSVVPSVVAQLRHDAGACWNVTVDAPRRNDVTRFDGAAR